MYRSNRKAWLKAVSSVLLGSCLVATCLQAVPVPKLVTLTWEHDAGTYSYNVYEVTNVSGPATWTLKTNVPDLSVQFEAEPGEHFFTVSCVDTNTGLEMPPLAPH